MGRRRLEEEGPNAAWLEAHAAERRAAWEAGRAGRRKEGRAARSAEPLSKRVHRLEVMLALSATAPAAAIGGGGGGSDPGSRMPPAAEQSFSGEHPHELARLWRIVADAVERLERLAESDPAPPLDSTDIDRVLLEQYRGYAPEDASRMDPQLGGPEAIRRVRLANGVSADEGI